MSGGPRPGIVLDESRRIASAGVSAAFAKLVGSRRVMGGAASARRMLRRRADDDDDDDSSLSLSP